MSACSFDQDDIFFPITKAGFFLVSDTISNTKTILRIAGEDVSHDWHTELGINQVDDIAGRGEYLWIANASTKQITQLDLSDNQSITTFEIAPLSPHFICAGTDYVLISDTINHSLGFLRLQNDKLTQKQVHAAPRMASYRSGRFYVSLGLNELAAWHEDALAQTNSWSFDHPIVDIQQDNILSTMVYTRDTTLFQSRINYNTLQMEVKEIPVVFDKIRHSPYADDFFGKAFLRQVALIDGKLSMTRAPEADNFEVDFFESRVYFQDKDSLYYFDIGEYQIVPLTQLNGKLVKAHYFQEAIGK